MLQKVYLVRIFEIDEYGGGWRLDKLYDSIEKAEARVEVLKTWTNIPEFVKYRIDEMYLK